LVNIDDFCAKHGCSRRELLDFIDEVMTDVNSLGTEQIKHELAVMKAKDYITQYQLEHLRKDDKL